MKPKNLIRPLLACAFFGTQIAPISAQTATNFPYGVTFDGLGDTPGHTSISTWGNTNARHVRLAAETGMVMLYSTVDGQAPYYVEGGVWLEGNPVTVMLAPNTPGAAANFNVTTGYTLNNTPPLLNINSQTGNTTFTNSNVIVTGGTLTVGGSPVVTSASAATAGYVNSSNFNSTLSAATPPTSSAWTATFVPRGNVTPVGLEGGMLALGTSTASGEKSLAAGSGSVASAMGAIALGTSNTASVNFATAIGQNATVSGQWGLAIGNGVSVTAPYAFAQGQNSTASFSYAFARGHTAVASGLASNALGVGASAKANAETALGSYNLESVVTNGVTANGLYGLLRIGNGTSTVRSDALTVLRSGETTLTNKEWKAAVVADPATALADPASTTDSSGNALVVDGHAVLNGKVTLAIAQGDISMGDYQ